MELWQLPYQRALKKPPKLVNFCAAILILKMEENMWHFQHIMLYYFRKDKNATEMQETICAVYGKDAVTDRTCQKWFVRFRAGDFLLDNPPHLGWPFEVDSDQIETLIENNQGYTMWETASVLKIFKSIKLLVKMKSVSFILLKKLNRLFGQPNTLQSRDKK